MRNVGFIDTYVRPLHMHKRGGRVDIQENQWVFDWKRTVMHGLINGGLEHKGVAVPDPLPYLNHVLFESMKQETGNLTIPVEAVLGFSNSGKGFYTQTRGIDRRWLTTQIQYPPYLVIDTADGGRRWTRRPEDGREQLLHFLFHLRQTMWELAERPLGKPKSSSPAAVAQILSDLPPRAAFVRSGEDEGMVYTYNAPRPAAGANWSERLGVIRAQTRSTYCQPREAVQQGYVPQGAEAIAPQAVERPLSTGPEPTIPRWEQVE
jgi:hypothetical protein